MNGSFNNESLSNVINNAINWLTYAKGHGYIYRDETLKKIDEIIKFLKETNTKLRLT